MGDLGEVGPTASSSEVRAGPNRPNLRRNADGRFEPFHLYSMRQAIDEGFIAEVLANYTTDYPLGSRWSFRR